MSNADWLRPSMLPKLALCGSYRPEENAGPAADRGTKLDTLFRALLDHENVSTGDLTTDEKEALRWAVDTARHLAGGERIQSREEFLKIEACGLKGTADALCEDALWSIDLKTGQLRNYVEQQAAYALGFMDSMFCDEWTVYLLFCDLQHVERLHFTREEAETLTRRTIAKAFDAEPPTPNEYCGWCANRMTCAARLELVALTVKDGAPLLADATSAQLREFVVRAKVVEDFKEEAAEILKERTIKGEKIPGVSLVTRRGSRKFPAAILGEHIKRLGTNDVMGIFGDPSEAKVKEVWERKLPDVPFPADKVYETPGSSYVRVAQPKALKG